MVPFILILLALSGLNVRAPACPQDPACNQLMMGTGAAMLAWLPPLVFLAALVITTARWRRHLPVFWIALLAMILVVVVLVVSALLMSWAW
ncbi:hypothetical protein [Agromyces sp. M3QZ16-3]|uniref:hypothetical protein n=1 Tax=Agromyces sp. M3QZ16-3 TaxID=3447585 RepID=UPI003F692E87